MPLSKARVLPLPRTSLTANATFHPMPPPPHPPSRGSLPPLPPPELSVRQASPPLPPEWTQKLIARDAACLLDGEWVQRNNQNKSRGAWAPARRCSLTCPNLAYSCTKVAGWTHSHVWVPNKCDMQEDLSEMKLLDASITFVGDSFARLFHDILLCYLNSLDDVEVHPIEVPTDCEANMVLYSESEEDCRRKHAILSHSVRNLTTNTAHDISFIWNPFFRTHTITEINKGQQNDYARHVAFDEGEDFLGISEQNFLMERAGKVVLYGTHHWTAKVYRVQRGSDWVYNSTLMNYLKED